MSDFGELIIIIAALWIVSKLGDIYRALDRIGDELHKSNNKEI